MRVTKYSSPVFLPDIFNKPKNQTIDQDSGSERGEREYIILTLLCNLPDICINGKTYPVKAITITEGRTRV